MNANQIAANKGIQSTNDTDTLSARVRRTAIAGAAAIALTGGGMVSANAATEMVSETSAAEKNWKRMAGAAAKQAVPSVERARQVLANAADKKSDLAIAIMVENKQKKALMDASDAVVKAEGNLFQRGLGHAEKHLDKARTNLDKAMKARELAQAANEFLAQEKADAARTVWKHTANELMTGGATKQDPATTQKETTFTDASGLSVDDFFSRIDRAIAEGKKNNAKMEKELNEPEFLKEIDHNIAKANRRLELLKAKQMVEPIIAKEPMDEIASKFDMPVTEVAKVSEVPEVGAKSVATETTAVASVSDSRKEWEKFLDRKTDEIKKGAEEIARIVEGSEHATDEEKATARETLTEVIEKLETELETSKGNEGNEGNEGSEGGDGSEGNGDDLGEVISPEVEPTDSNVDTEETAVIEQPAVEEVVTQPAFSAEQAMASGVVLTQMANAAQQNAELFRKGMQDRVSGDDAFMQPVDIATAGTGISTWAQAMGGQTTTQGRGDLAGFSVRGAGMVAGVDVKKNNTRVGVAVGYGDANVDANGENGQNASSKVSTYSVGLYGAHEVDGWFANGGVSYSAHSIKSQRAAKLGGEVYGLSAKTNATTVGGFAQFGKHIVTNAVNIDPSITLKVSNTSVKGFTENGDAGLEVDGSNFNSARVGIGARLWKEFGDASHSVTPSLRISYERELAHAAPSMDVALANAASAGTMTVMGNKLGRDILSAEAGIDVKFGKKLSLRGGVNGSVRQGQTQAGVAGSLKYVW
ncbi:autotransporter domain-containing protein [Pandoraea fibrosis]|uniref:Autotransporter domain-containing protein n=1 Tax=Pandoraea fibrosis TaxID=1891094 RepID=A0ABX6HR87_9BURK|nr:autotransporter outer membrane beta-barrel domain-containing protein [Pandoraea fibrosis]QHE93366.1 autotransporter domain-containing protein [Pandoraea fibrosis]QHF13074.1 autotransporter domain-containing protein [Pandoraea fibrosis]